MSIKTVVVKTRRPAMSKTVVVETRLCRRCRKEMSDRFCTEVDVKPAATLDHCVDCHLWLERNRKVRFTKKLVGATIVEVVVGELIRRSGDFDRLIIKDKQGKRWEIKERYGAPLDCNFVDDNDDES